MSMFKNVMVYLGLGPDEEYEDSYLGRDVVSDDDLEVDVRSSAVGFDDQAVAMGGDDGRVSHFQHQQPSAVGAVRPLRPVPTDGAEFEDGGAVRPVGVIDDLDEPTVRPMPIQRSKPRAISPQSFGDAKILADEFKRSIPVTMNLTSVDRDLARRLIDFASGVCYSLGGTMEKLAPQVFLLIPKSVEVSDEDRRRIEERGYDR